MIHVTQMISNVSIEELVQVHVCQHSMVLYKHRYFVYEKRDVQDNKVANLDFFRGVSRVHQHHVAPMIEGQ